MKKLMPWIAVLGVLAIIVLWCAGVYNRFVTAEEQVESAGMIAQGGLFKTPEIAQQALADFLGMPITIMETADAGGPWGMALLAVYAAEPEDSRKPLADFLDQEVFRGVKSTTCTPTAAGREGADRFIKAYRSGLPAEIAAAAIADVDE